MFTTETPNVVSEFDLAEGHKKRQARIIKF